MYSRTSVLLIRHGECPGNIEGRIRGHTDFPLNENGLLQAEAAAKALATAPIEKIYTSPLLRSLSTAQKIGELGGFEVEIDEAFNNVCMGPWEGRRKVDIAQDMPAEWKIWIENPEALELEGAETLKDVERRALARLDKLVDRHRGKTFAIVSHRGVLKPMITGAIGVERPSFWRVYIDNASISEITFDDRFGYCLTKLNDTHHLHGIPGVVELE
jgi:broad specificity phosphatase PhoE